MSKKYSAYDLVVDDIIKINDSDIIFKVYSISRSNISLMNTNKNDIRISRAITTIDYYRTEPIQRWQEQLEKMGFEYLTDKTK